MKTRKSTQSLWVLIAVAMAGLTFDAAAEGKPLKVYILAGQSNMEGHAKVEKVIELRRQGVPPKDIAAKLDISVASVHRIAPASIKSKP